jgi:hypothetical protein
MKQTRTFFLPRASSRLAKYESNYICPNQINQIFIPSGFIYQNNLNITDKAYKKAIEEISNENIKKRTIRFLEEFNHILSNIDEIANPLPKMQLNMDSDSALCEWKFSYFRFGFCLMEKDGDSHWYLVVNRKMEEQNILGDLPDKEMRSVILRSIKFALENT